MKLCITTVVDSRYWDWVELFTWCCKKSYPEYDVKILKKEQNLEKILEKLNQAAHAGAKFTEPNDYSVANSIGIGNVDIEKMCEFTLWIMAPGGLLPALSDTDRSVFGKEASVTLRLCLPASTATTMRCGARRLLLAHICGIADAGAARGRTSVVLLVDSLVRRA
jgi:hypothetical protein